MRSFVHLSRHNSHLRSYLNSLLQSLFHIPAFRRAVYAMPVAADQKPTDSIALAMQRLFYHLEKSSVAGTRELTKSFGWGASLSRLDRHCSSVCLDGYEAFTQHDVQEMLRVLTDNLEEKMKESGQAGLIQQLFRGELLNYIECVNVDCVSERREHFYDLPLNVKGCATLYESIDKFVEEEVS